MKLKLGVAVLVALVAVLFATASAGGVDGQGAGDPDPVIDSLVAGGAHTCGVLDDGGMMCWGANESGQLGTTANEQCGVMPVFPCSTVPIRLEGLAGDVIDVAAGEYHTCALVAGGTVQCWGSDEHEQLGAAPTETCGSEPFAFACTDVPLDVEGISGTPVAIDAGDFHTCVLIDDGTVECWGGNENGQLGDGTFTDRASPTPVSGLADATAIAVGGFHTCAIDSGGGAQCWGKNEDGQVGDGLACGEQCLVPVQVTGLTSGIAELSAAGLHTCSRSDAGAVKCWGFNFDGQVGDGTSQNIRTTPVDVVGLSAGIVTISANGVFTGHTCVITSLGAILCWGDNGDGQLGDDSVDDRFVPTQVEGIQTGATQVAAGYEHTCAIVTGAVWCWGENASGQLGTGTRTTSDVPVLVNFDAPPLLLGDADCDTNVTSIDAALVLQLTAQLLESLACPAGGDVNASGAIDAIDAALILQFVAGLILAF